MDAKLQALEQAMEAIKVPCFLLCGSLLGAVRDGELIDWDHDVDIGIFERDRRRMPWSLKVEEIFGDDTSGVEYRMRFNDVLVDLFFVHQHRDRSWFYVDGYEYHYPPISQCIAWDVGGVEVEIPKNYEECLVANYGDDWREPKRQWKWDEAPCCHKKV